MNPSLIPAVDSAGLPGPVWLFQLLLVLTFFLHLLFVNLTLGGSLLGWIAHLVAGGRMDDPRGVLAGRMVAVNGYGISLTITTGVAPLLFIQVLYQQFFYTGTILLGWFWLGALGFLAVGYYAVYLYKFRGLPARGRGGGLWLGLSAVLFLGIAMVQVAVYLVHVQPARWTTIADAPLAVLGDPAYWPRLLHFVLAGVAFSALVMTWWAVRQVGQGVETETNRAIARWTWRWALWATAAQIVDGLVLLLVLRRPVLLGLMQGGAATLIPLTLAIAGAVGLLVMLARVTDPATASPTVTGAVAAVVAVVAVMTVTRHQVRLLDLTPAADLSAFAIRPQWLNLGLFAVLLVAALAVVAWMVRRVLVSRASGSEAA